MGSLYECLREARLEKFYPTLRANGFSSAESLTELTSDDLSCLVDVTSDEHRRLCELVDIIRSVYEVDIDDLPNVSEATAYSVSMPVNRQPRQSKPRKRNRSSQYGTNSAGLRRSETVTESHRPKPSVRRHLSLNDHDRGRPQSLYAQTGAAAYRESGEESDSSNDDTDSGPSDYEPATKHVSRVAATPPRTRKVATVERIKHTTGYNYGLPRNKIKQKTSQSRVDISDKIRVCVRKRPRNKREIRAADDDVVVVERSDTVTINEPKLAVDLRPYTLQHEFCFDEVFHEGCGNEEVFERAAKPLIDCVFQGGSATCFAYGQTGAGKTHTMLGSRENPGLYLLSAQEIFSITQSGQYGRDLRVWVSFFEIYCGQLFDLLNKRNKLHAREDGSHRVCIAGLTETQVTDVTSIMQVLEYGNQVRSKGSTGVNPDSSRSHAILQVEVRNEADRRHGRMSFIDLAGSERAADVTDTDRQTRMEGAEINQSLLALKECIRSIDQDSRHTPFRQSKLTHILKDSFIGNSRTCMIANISPTGSACENSLNTLRYADRVKELRKSAGQNLRASRAIAQTVLNVPFTTPASVFHPSNISCESTPVRPRASRIHAGRRSPPSDLPDPAETPIRGNFSGIRKTSRESGRRRLEGMAPTSRDSRESTSGSSVTTSVHRESFQPAVSRERLEPTVSASVIRERLEPQVRSSTDSDPTLSDTCNMAVQDIAVRTHVKPHELVASSNDTDLDAVDQSLEEINEQLNDLNKTGGMSENPDQCSDSIVPTASAPDPRIYPRPAQHLSVSSRSSMNVPEVSERDTGLNSQEATMERETYPTRTSYSSKPLVIRPKPNDFEEETLCQLGDDVDDVLFGSWGYSRSKSSASREPNRLEGLPQTRETIETQMGVSRTTDSTSPRMSDLQVPQASPAKSSDLTSFSRSENMKLRAAPMHNILSGHNPNAARIQPEDICFEDHTADENRAVNLEQDCLQRNIINSQPEETLQQIPERDIQSRRDKTDPLLARHKARQNMPNPREFLRHLTKQAWSKPTAQTTPVVANIPLPVLPSNTPTQQSHQHRQYSIATELSQRPDSLSDQETDLKRVPSSNSLRGYSSPSSTTTDSPGRKMSDGTGSGPSSLSPVDFRKPATEARQRRRSRSNSRDRESRKSGTPTTVESSASHRPITPQLTGEGSKSPALVDRIAGLTTDCYLTNMQGEGPQLGASQNIPRSEFIRPAVPSLPSPPHLLTLSDTHNQPSSSVIMELSAPKTIPTFMEIGVSQSSTNNLNTVITTEKLTTLSTVAGFSPIHPQPLTANRGQPRAITRDLATISSTASSVSVSTSGSIMKATSNLQRLATAGVPADSTAAKNHIITAHEEELAAITSLCKQEMKLLLAYRAGNKETEEYVRRMKDILNLKMKTISLLQDQIDVFLPTRDQNKSAKNQT